MGNKFVRQLIVVIALVGGLSGAVSKANVVYMSEYGLPLVNMTPNGQPMGPKDAWSSLSELSHLLNNEVHQMRQYAIPPGIFKTLPNQMALWTAQAMSFQVQDYTEIQTGDLEHSADVLWRQLLTAPLNGPYPASFYQAYRNFAISLTNANYLIAQYQYAEWAKYLRAPVYTRGDWEIQSIVARRLQRIEILKWEIIQLDRQIAMHPKFNIWCNTAYPLPNLQGTQTPYVLGNYMEYAGAQQQNYQAPQMGTQQQGQYVANGGQVPESAMQQMNSQPYPFIPQDQNNNGWNPYLAPNNSVQGYPQTRYSDYSVPANMPNIPPAININIGGSTQTTNVGNSGGGGLPVNNLPVNNLPANSGAAVPTTSGTALAPALQQTTVDPVQASGVVVNPEAPIGPPKKYKF